MHDLALLLSLEVASQYDRLLGLVLLSRNERQLALIISSGVCAAAYLVPKMHTHCSAAQLALWCLKPDRWLHWGSGLLPKLVPQAGP